MNAETLYTINGGKLIALSPGTTTPRGLGAAIAFNLKSFVESPGLPIGSWDQTVHDDRPAAMSFTAEGSIVSVVVARMDGDKIAVADRIAAIHAWLAPMQLRDLSQLFTEPAAFYEGLWDMSPNATIALQDERRYVVVTAEDDTSIHDDLGSSLENARIELVHLDVFTSDSGDDPIIRWSPEKGRPPISPESVDSDTQSAQGTGQLNTVMAADDAASENGRSATRLEDPDTAESQESPEAEPEEATIDLRDGSAESIAVDSADAETGDDAPSGEREASSVHGEFVPGRTYEITWLPSMFDPDDALLESISDEMFAVPGHLVLVDKLPERRRQPSPFENPGRYRWDADTDEQATLETNLFERDGARVLHLFVESDRQPGLATYVGVLTTAVDNKAGRYSTSMWFDIDPKVNAPLWQLFRKGRLPELGDTSASDLSTTQA